jgi:hypothetical protein
MTQSMLATFAVSLLLLGGCAGRQDYQVLRRDRAPDVLATSQFVVEGQIKWAYARHWRFRLGKALLSPFVPFGDEPDDWTYDAYVVVDRVQKGHVPWRGRVIKNVRMPTPEEARVLRESLPPRMFPVFMIGFDGASDGHLRGMKVLSIGDTATPVELRLPKLTPTESTHTIPP